MHHWRNGWHFARQDNGSVSFEHRVPTGELNELGHATYTIDAKDNIPADEWASIVAAVSATGEVGTVWHRARALHAGDE